MKRSIGIILLFIAQLLKSFGIDLPGDIETQITQAIEGVGYLVAVIGVLHKGIKELRKKGIKLTKLFIVPLALALVPLSHADDCMSYTTYADTVLTVQRENELGIFDTIKIRDVQSRTDYRSGVVFLRTKQGNRTLTPNKYTIIE